MSLTPGTFPKPFDIYRGTDFKISLTFRDRETKEPINYANATFTAVLISDQTISHSIVATFTEEVSSSLSGGIFKTKLSKIETPCLTQSQLYFRLYIDGEDNERFLYAVNEVNIRD